MVHRWLIQWCFLVEGMEVILIGMQFVPVYRERKIPKK